jgi:hypothetical protein
VVPKVGQEDLVDRWDRNQQVVMRQPVDLRQLLVAVVAVATGVVVQDRRAAAAAADRTT